MKTQMKFGGSNNFTSICNFGFLLSSRKGIQRNKAIFKITNTYETLSAVLFLSAYDRNINGITRKLDLEISGENRQKIEIKV